jgi:hypothetical protein
MVLSRNSPEGTEKNHDPPVRIAGNLDEIRNGHLPNTKLLSYCFSNLLD